MRNPLGRVVKILNRRLDEQNFHRTFRAIADSRFVRKMANLSVAYLLIYILRQTQFRHPSPLEFAKQQ